MTTSANSQSSEDRTVQERVWTPDPSVVSKKEVVGRRTFGQDKQIFVQQEPLHYKYDIFLDDELAADLSLDRLGLRAAELKVITLLSPLGERHGQRRTPPRSFRGWAQIKVADLSGLKIRPTKAKGEENPYHAELSRDEFRTKNQARALAYQLCVLAARNAFIKPILSEENCN